MAFAVGGFPVTITGTCAAADYTANEGHVVYSNAGVITITANATTCPLGLLDDPGTGASTLVSVVTLGPGRGKIGAAVTYDDRLASDGNAHLIPTTTLGDYTVAAPMTLADLASDDLVYVMVYAALRIQYAEIV